MRFRDRAKRIIPFIKWLIAGNPDPQKNRRTKLCPSCGRPTYADGNANYCVCCAAKLPDWFNDSKDS